MIKKIPKLGYCIEHKRENLSEIEEKKKKLTKDAIKIKALE